MRAEDRKAAVAAYKERKVEAGIYAVRCVPSEEVWVGSAPDLSTIQNRLWFELRQGKHSQPSLQQAWDAYGSDAFIFETVDRLTEDQQSGYIRSAAIKQLHLDWIAELNGTRI